MEFPGPDPTDPPDVAKMLHAAAGMWAAQKHNESILHLARAAALAATKNPARAKHLSDAALALTSVIDRGDDPRSIPLSIDFDAESVQSAMIEIIEPAGKPQFPPPRTRKGTMPEEFREGPDTVKVDVAELRIPPPRTMDLTSTVPQGYAPKKPDEHSAETKRWEEIVTKRDPKK